MGSLRGRLFVYLIGGTTLALLVAGFVLRPIVADALQREFDRALLAKARGLVALTEQEGDQVEFEFQEEHMPEFAAGAEPEYFELWLADGSLVQRSPSFDASDQMRAASLARSPHPATTPSFRDVRLPDGRRGRQIQIDFVPSIDPEDAPAEGSPGPEASSRSVATLLVAREREQLDAAIRRLELTVAALGIGLMLALAGLMQLALRVGLRSLDRLTGQVRALDVGSLDARVDVTKPPREIAVVVEQVNALLARLEAGFTRERRLSSDIAHELKTPIAELRNLSEVGARWPEDRATVRQFFEDAGAIAQQMERIVVHLLALARYDEGRERVWTAPVQVAEVVDAAWKPLAREALAKGLEFRQDDLADPEAGDGSGEVRADRGQPPVQRRRLQPAGHRRDLRVGGDQGTGVRELRQPGRESRAPGSRRDVRPVLAEGRGPRGRPQRGAGAGARAGAGRSSRDPDRDAPGPRPDVPRDAVEARHGLRRGQKRNCTSARTTQAPPFRSGKAAPGEK